MFGVIKYDYIYQCFIVKLKKVLIDLLGRNFLNIYQSCVMKINELGSIWGQLIIISVIFGGKENWVWYQFFCGLVGGVSGSQSFSGDKFFLSMRGRVNFLSVFYVYF